MMIDERELLERARSSFEPEPGLTDRIYRRRDRKRRNKRIIAGIVGIAVFVAVVWIVRDVASLDRARPATQPTQTPVSAVGPVPDSDYLLDLGTGEMTPLPEGIRGGGYAGSPDGSRLAYTKKNDEGMTQIFVGNLDGTGAQQVTHGFEAASSPAWSPDGSKIAYIGYHDGDLRDLFVLDLATGVSTQLSFSTLEPDPAEPDFDPWRSELPSFTPDGSSIVYNANRGDNIDRGEVEVRMVPVAGGESVVLMRDRFNDGTAAFYAAQLSPDGSLLSYGCGWGANDICVGNLDGTGERVLAPFQGDSLNGGVWSPEGTRIAYYAFHAQDVYVVDVATGEVTYVAEGGGPSTWLDDHTLLIEMSGGYDRRTGQLCHNPPGDPGCHKG